MEKCIYCGFHAMEPCRNSMYATGCVNYREVQIESKTVPMEVVAREAMTGEVVTHYVTPGSVGLEYRRYPDGRWTVKRSPKKQESQDTTKITHLIPDNPSPIQEYLAKQQEIQKFAEDGAAIAAQYFMETGKKDAAAIREFRHAADFHATPRARILSEAMEIVHKDRNANYGNPEDNFKQIADLWNAYWIPKVKRLEARDGFTPRFDSADVAIMNALIKVARLSVNPAHHDSAVDIAGYAACLGDIQYNLRTNAAGSSNSGSSEKSQS